jgi:hypothetical protein
MWLAWKAGTSSLAPRGALLVAAGLAALVVILMAIMRNVVRRETLGAAAPLDAIQVVPQLPVIGPFALLLVAGLATVGWMLVVARHARTPA